MPNGLFTLKQQVLAIREGGWPGQPPTSVNYLVVAGGGGGGKGNGGGGGAGGLLQGNFPITPGTSYTVTVGSGGSGATSYVGTSGGNSVFGAISSTGGGGGGGGTSQAPLTGGSGGGAGTAGALPGASGVSGQGNAGGASIASGIYPGGGGGGAGTVGLAGGSTGGNGGAGAASDVSGSRVTYAGGGGGGTDSGTAGTGGAGGGGSGGSNAIGSPGATNAGGGGGGAGFTNGTAGGNGGSGIVIVSYPGSTQWFTGGVVNYYNGNVIHMFYQSGTLAPTAPTSLLPSYQISRSLRFNSADTAYLNRTPASASNQRTWTWSGWVKRSALSASRQGIFISTNSAGNVYAGIEFSAQEELVYYDSNSPGSTSIVTSQVFRDVSSWYHIVCAVDTTQSTASNRVKLYLNGSQITAFSFANYPPQNSDTRINSTNLTVIGSWQPAAGLYFSGYMTEVYLIDGQALTPSSFGETNAQTGVWQPKAYSGSYGTNGFYLNFSDNSNTTAATLGKDYSGNGNNWTPNNFSVSAGVGNDSLVDTPTPYGLADTGVGGEVRGNYATWNPLVVNKPNLTNGNLDADGSDLKTAISTMGVSSGKWYWEITIGSGTNTPNMGVTSFANDNADPGVYLGSGRSYVSSGGGSGVYKNYTATSTVADSDFSNANTAGAVIGFALDCDVGTLAYYVNNVLGHIDTTIAAGTVLYPMTCNFNSTANNYRNTSVNFGQRPFAYTAPAGFRALTTWNLPTPTIGATSTTQADDYFNAVLYTGDRTDRTITVGFQPDWVWVKSRNQADNHYLMNAVVGTGKYLCSNLTDAEATNANTLTAFTSTGFSIGNTGTTNETGRTYVAWNWKANGAGSSNTAGSITSTVSANTTSGFSIVTFTATANSGSIGHGLGVAPSMIILKSRNNTSNWVVYHASIGADKYLNLNTTDAAITNTATWQNTTPTSTVFYSNGPFVSGWTEVAYCFAEVAGYSKFGSYTGNGSSDGPFVFCGFRPAWLLYKLSSASGENWWIVDAKRDTYNIVGNIISPSLSNGEFSNSSILDFTSNGFKIRTNSGTVNINGSTYIFAAFAEFPQKFSLAR